MELLSTQQSLLLNMLRAHRTRLFRLSVALCAPNIGGIPMGSGSSCLEGIGGRLGEAAVERTIREGHSGSVHGFWAEICILVDGMSARQRSRIRRM
jgi:hypothetical protein